MALRTLPEFYQDTGFCDVRVALDDDAIIVATQNHPAMYFRHGTWETLVVKHRDKVAFDKDFNFSVTKKPDEANKISTILMDCNNLINQAADLRAKLEEMRERLGVES
jgi:uncharacterized protein with von Willebrand factor type A (vWA) domain